MKNYLVLLFLYSTTSLAAFSQIDTICSLLPQKNGLVYYSEIIEIKQATAVQLYSNTKIWISETFKDPKSVIQTDVENSSLTIKALLNFPDSPSTKIRVTMIIQFKDGKCKYELSNIYMVMSQFKIDNPLESIPAYTNCNVETLQKFDLSIRDFVGSLKTKLNSVDYSW